MQGWKNSFKISKIVNTNKLTVYPQISCWSPNFSSNRLKASKSVFVSNSISFLLLKKSPNFRSFSFYITRGPFFLGLFLASRFQKRLWGFYWTTISSVAFVLSYFYRRCSSQIFPFLTRLGFGRSEKLRKDCPLKNAFFQFLKSPILLRGEKKLLFFEVGAIFGSIKKCPSISVHFCSSKGWPAL